MIDPINRPMLGYMLVGIRGLGLACVDMNTSSNAGHFNLYKSPERGPCGDGQELVAFLSMGSAQQAGSVSARRFHRISGVFGTMHRIIAVRAMDGVLLGEWRHQCSSTDPVCW